LAHGRQQLQQQLLLAAAPLVPGHATAAATAMATQRPRPA
jgi:hypothetical protein